MLTNIRCCLQQSRFVNILILGLLGLGLILSACQDKEQQPSIISVATVNKISTTPYVSSAAAWSPTIISSAVRTNSTLSSLTPTVSGVVSPTTMNVSSKDWFSRWLKGIPCRPPCYEGIIPGKTTAEEAQKLLEQISVIEKITLNSSFHGSPEAFIYWTWKKELLDPNTPSLRKGSAVLYDDKVPGSPIKRITVEMAFLKLEDVIQAYGDPSHVIATFYKNYNTGGYSYTLDLYYLSQGFLVSSGTSTVIPSLTSGLPIAFVNFSIPGEEGITPSEGLYGKELLVPWQGFKDWKFYCRYYYDYGKRTEVRDCSQVPGIGSP